MRGPLKKDDFVDSEFDKNGKRKRFFYNMHNLVYGYHRHFIFSPIEERMPTKDEKKIHEQIVALKTAGRSGDPKYDNNIGYGTDELGKAVLYSEDYTDRGFELKERISKNPTDDMKLIESMKKFTTKNEKYETYDLYKSNCQDWVEDVRDDAGL